MRAWKSPRAVPFATSQVGSAGGGGFVESSRTVTSPDRGSRGGDAVGCGHVAGASSTARKAPSSTGSSSTMGPPSSMKATSPRPTSSGRDDRSTRKPITATLAVTQQARHAPLGVAEHHSPACALAARSAPRGEGERVLGRSEPGSERGIRRRGGGARREREQRAERRPREDRESRARAHGACLSGSPAPVNPISAIARECLLLRFDPLHAEAARPHSDRRSVRAWSRSSLCSPTGLPATSRTARSTTRVAAGQRDPAPESSCRGCRAPAPARSPTTAARSSSSTTGPPGAPLPCRVAAARALARPPDQERRHASWASTSRTWSGDARAFVGSTASPTDAARRRRRHPRRRSASSASPRPS